MTCENHTISASPLFWTDREMQPINSVLGNSQILKSIDKLALSNIRLIHPNKIEFKARNLDSIFKGNCSCQPSNYVYTFPCPKCKPWYTGETGNLRIPQGPDITKNNHEKFTRQVSRSCIAPARHDGFVTGNPTESAALEDCRHARKDACTLA